LIAVKNSRHKGYQVIKERLTLGLKNAHQTSNRERGHGRDITWTLRAMPAPPWVVENWPGSAMIIEVRSKGKRQEKRIDETRTYVTSLRTGADALLRHGRDRWSNRFAEAPKATRTPGTGLATPSSTRLPTASASATACR
jgi:hypothetical protein